MGWIQDFFVGVQPEKVGKNWICGENWHLSSFSNVLKHIVTAQQQPQPQQQNNQNCSLVVDFLP